MSQELAKTRPGGVTSAGGGAFRPMLAAGRAGGSARFAREESFAQPF